MEPTFLRDAAMAVAILAVAAFCWFGWALERPPRAWRLCIVLGATASFTMMAAGITRVVNAWDSGTVFDRDTAIAFGVVVLVEFALSGIGAWVLAARRRADLLPPWIAAVVGIHFVPLAVILELPLLYGVAALTVGAAIIAHPVAVGRDVAISASTGTLTGFALLIGALGFFVTLL